MVIKRSLLFLLKVPVQFPLRLMIQHRYYSQGGVEWVVILASFSFTRIRKLASDFAPEIEEHSNLISHVNGVHMLPPSTELSEMFS